MPAAFPVSDLRAMSRKVVARRIIEELRRNGSRYYTNRVMTERLKSFLIDMTKENYIKMVYHGRKGWFVSLRELGRTIPLDQIKLEN